MNGAAKGSFGSGAGWQAARQHLVQPGSTVRRPTQLKPILGALQLGKSAPVPADLTRLAQVRWEQSQVHGRGQRPVASQEAATAPGPAANLSQNWERMRAQILRGGAQV